ncbi:unnamed protein product [Schistocephalus solidus]|uniref:AAA domain-containing protein n=1 Tax=Schistocephalus solidus TaxID=70667 RepID=A0A183TQL3_SCHSO|nr:unnamed protein product [Schistocephalus solidus]
MVLLRARNSEFKANSVDTNGRKLRAVPSRLSYREPRMTRPLVHRRITEMSTKSRSPAKKVSKSGVQHLPEAPTFSLSQALHTSELNEVIGREKEIEFLRKTMEDCISQKRSASLYISGAPGTGKTATVTQEVQALLKTGRCQAIFINCMQLQTPKAVFARILSTLSVSCSFPSSSENVVAAVEACLTKKSRRLPLIIVLDEIDQLAGAYQDVLYTIFGWPDGLTDSHLILLGIANALDLTERLLPGLQSRSLRPLHLSFPPYSKDQISQIISDRLLRQSNSSGSSVQALDKLAIQFCAKKVDVLPLRFCALPLFLKLCGYSICLSSWRFFIFGFLS